MITDSFISEVEIAKILIFSSANALNVLNVTPGVVTIPAPTIEIFETLLLWLKFLNLIFLLEFIVFNVSLKSFLLTVNVKSVVFPSDYTF